MVADMWLHAGMMVGGQLIALTLFLMNFEVV
jgi:hypothetical protein